MREIDDDILCLAEVDRSDYALLKRYMKADFPGLNMIPFVLQRRALRSGMLRACFLSQGGKVLGYAVFHHINELAATQVLYLAILPAFRSAGLGGQLLNMLRQTRPGYTLLLEVDQPIVDAQARDKLRRIAFYKRNGFELIPDVVVNVVGHPMLIMTDGPMEADWAKLYTDIYCTIYGTRLFSPLVKVSGQ